MPLAEPRLAYQLRTSIEREISLRQAARQIELDPNRAKEAAELFAHADRVRAERVALLANRCEAR